MAKPKLNARQAEFVRHYTTGADGVRGNLGKAYAAAGYVSRGNTAVVAAGRLFTNVHVQEAIAAAHEAAQCAATQTLAEWKDLAVDAQRRVVTIAHGSIPDRETGKAGTAIVDRETAAVGKLLLDANLEIIERAYPKKLNVEHSGTVPSFVALPGPVPTSVAEWVKSYGAGAQHGADAE